MVMDRDGGKSGPLLATEHGSLSHIITAVKLIKILLKQFDISFVEGLYANATKVESQQASYSILIYL